MTLIARLINANFVSTKDRKSTRLNSSHSQISYAVFCLKKKKIIVSHIRCNSQHNAYCMRLLTDVISTIYSPTLITFGVAVWLACLPYHERRQTTATFM